MSRLIPKLYEQFKNQNFNDFIGERINTELVKDLWGINVRGNSKSDNERLKTFKSTHNLAYLGEVLERYKDRGIVKTKEDLRALLVYTHYSLIFESPDMNTNQLELFISSVEEEAIKNRDTLSIGIILACSKFKEYIKEDEELCSILIDEVEKGNLSFEDKVWAMYSCWEYLDSTDKFISSNNLVSMLDSVKDMKCNLLKVLSGIEIESLKYYEDYYLYLMLAEMGNKEDFFTTSKNFRNKKVCNQYKRLVSMLKKEYTELTIKTITDVLPISDKDVYLYNYLLTQDSYYAYVETKITGKGSMRLFYKMLERLASYKVCSTIVETIVEDKITEISNEKDYEESGKYYTYTKGYKKAREIVFKDFLGKVSVENFPKFIELTHIDEDEYRFFDSSKYSYIFSPEYSDIIKKIRSKNVINVANKCLYSCKDNSLVLGAYNYLTEMKLKHNLSASQYKNLYSLGVLDEKSMAKYDCIDEARGYYEYLKDKVTYEEFLKELKDFYNKLDEIEIYVQGHVGKYDLISKYTGLIRDFVEDINLYENLINRDLAREYQIFEDNLAILSPNRLDYYLYLEEKLKNKDYVDLMELSDTDIKSIFKTIYKHLLEEPTPKYSCSLSRLINRVKAEILTDEEKEKEAINKVIDIVVSSPSLSRIDSALEKDFAKTNKEYVLKIKEIFLGDSLKDRRHSGYTSIRESFEIVKKLIQLDAFNDDELLAFSKECVESV